SANWMNCGSLLPSFPPSEFLWNLWITELVFIEVKEVQTQAVLYFALAQIVQVRLPMPVLGQIVGHVSGQKNMPGIAAIHHPPRENIRCLARSDSVSAATRSAH